jgi:uncharacterized protein (DUF427 family)
MGTMLAEMAGPGRIEPGPGQESVWDYPRPPRLEPTSDRLRVVVGDVTVADTTVAFRVLETSQPPGYYLPPADVRLDHLEPSTTRTFCEWKGLASYFHVRVGDRLVHDAAWSYPEPTAPFAAIAGHLAFYPQKVDACFVGDELVEANDGAFYGGWITSRVVGPFKGGPGTALW